MTDHTRRAFVGTTVGAAAWAAAFARTSSASPTSSSGAAPDRMSRLTLGIASYSFREFTLDQALDMAKTLGVTHMTFKDVHVPRTDPPEATRALRAKIQAAGITIVGGGTINIANDPVQIKKEFEYAKNAGFPMIYTSPVPEALDTLEQLAKTYDIKVAIHNHGPEDKLWPRPQDAYAAVKSRDRRLGLCVDIGHTIRTGTDPVQACREVRDRLYDMHVKDLTVKTDQTSETKVGRGVIDFPALFRTLIEIGYKGQVGLEYEIEPKNPLPGMIESMAYMRGVLAATSC
jgi:sugar phosphate isomerase/epimerase